MQRIILVVSALLMLATGSFAAAPPNIVLLMTDDQGWGQTGYYNHPVLKTPNLDAMAANGLRFDRFYAAGPVCSPTRASVLTGRTHDRSGVRNHGYALRRQEKTLAAALRQAGYATGHFGKWHLNGLRGPGVPILADDPHGPGAFGFETWVSVSNFFDLDPVMSRNGIFEDLVGDSSAIIVREALTFIRASIEAGKPFLAVVWDGSPHSPFRASDEDISGFDQLPESSQKHHGELVAFDRSVGTLRRGLRELGVAENTVVWFCSDNGGLGGVTPATVGGLRGHKGRIYEGGIRVPGIIEWPAGIGPRVTKYPAGTIDIFPTVADLVGLPPSALLQPVDGISLKPLFGGELEGRPSPLPFRFKGQGALIDNHFKLVATSIPQGSFELYDLDIDPTESVNLADKEQERYVRMKKAFVAWNESVESSVAGKDYSEGKVADNHPAPRTWENDARYKPYLDEWRQRPEYATRLKAALRKSGK